MRGSSVQRVGSAKKPKDMVFTFLFLFPQAGGLLCLFWGGGLTWKPAPGPRAHPSTVWKGECAAVRACPWRAWSLLAAGEPKMVCQPRARPFWVFCKVQLTIWPSHSGTMVTRSPETTVSGSPSPRRPLRKDKKCDLPLLL